MEGFSSTSEAWRRSCLLALQIVAVVIPITAANASNIDPVDFWPRRCPPHCIPSTDDIINSLTRGLGRTPPPRPIHRHTVKEASLKPSVSVLFQSDSALLTILARRQLDTIGLALRDRQLGGRDFRIEGHADPVGDEHHNLILSHKRAQTVADYLAETSHVDRSRLLVVGTDFGKSLVAPGAEIPEPRNRSVTIVTDAK